MMKRPSSVVISHYDKWSNNANEVIRQLEDNGFEVHSYETEKSNRKGTQPLHRETLVYIGNGDFLTDFNHAISPLEDDYDWETYGFYQYTYGAANIEITFE